MTADTINTPPPPPVGEEGASTESEPPPTCVDISIEDERWNLLAGFPELIPLLAASALLAIELPPETYAVSIALLSDAEIRSLNKAFRGKDTATNVLSFPSPPISRVPANRFGPVFLGDVALAYETVVREALDQHKPALHHAAHLAVHGILHLAGLRHDSDAGAERMEEAERLVLAGFGIPDPYADDPLAPTNSL